MSMWMRGAGAGVSALVLIGLVGCGSNPVQEAGTQYGIYAVDGGGDLLRLDGSPEWERQTWSDRQALDPKLTLLIHDPQLRDPGAVSTLRQTILLEKVARVREQVDVKTGRRAPVNGDNWVASQVARFRIPVDFGPAPDRTGMIWVTPRQSLEPGLYSVRLGREGDFTLARFGIDWPGVNKQVYANLHCVDRYQGAGSSAYFDCQGEPPHATTGLKIGELKSTRHTVDGVPMLSVVGVVENTSDRPLRIPPLRARLESRQGVEQLWTFELDRLYLLPAERAKFRSEIEWPMANSSQIHVSFHAPGES